MPEQPLLFTYWLLRHPDFLIHPPFPTQSVRLPLVTYSSLCSTFMTYRMPCPAIGHQVLPTQPLSREAKDFPRGDKYFKHVPYLIYFYLYVKASSRNINLPLTGFEPAYLTSHVLADCRLIRYTIELDE